MKYNVFMIANDMVIHGYGSYVVRAILANCTALGLIALGQDGCLVAARDTDVYFAKVRRPTLNNDTRTMVRIAMGEQDHIRDHLSISGEIDMHVKGVYGRSAIVPIRPIIADMRIDDS